MKQCHACGQKLPLKVGDVVEFVRSAKVQRGTVVTISPLTGAYVDVLTFDGHSVVSVAVMSLTRLHGYYRVTERESMA